MPPPASPPGITPDRPAARFLDRRTPPTLVTLILLAGLSALVMNIYLPSLPAMAAWFGVSYGVMQQSVTLYLAFSAGLQIIIGPLSDRFGRRKVTLGSLIIFAGATAGTLLAPDAATFLTFRMAQAAVASGMVLSRAIVRDITSDAGAAAKIAYVTMGMSLVPMVGPVIGGVLDEAFGWQASFVLLLILGLVVLILAWADLGETAAPSSVSVVAQFRQYPHLLTSRRFWGYSLSAAFSSGCFFAFLGGAPYVGNTVFGLGSAEVGLYFGLPALGYLVGNFIAGRISARVGLNRMVLLGTLIGTGGLVVLLVLTLTGLSGPEAFFGLMITIGLGNGICLPNANAGLLSVRPELAGSASGLGGALLIGGGAALAGLAGMLLGPGASELPLVLLMLASNIMAILCILAVMRRARSLGLKT